MTSALVERDIPAYSSQRDRDSARVIEDPRGGYWTELELALRFANARDRLAARQTNAHFATLNAQPFGSLPTGDADEGPDLLAGPEAVTS